MELREPVELNIEAIRAKIKLAEDHYKSLEPLVLYSNKIIKLKKDNTHESFVRKFFDKFSLEYITLVKSNNNLYCEQDCRRSIEDVFRLADSHFKDVIGLEDILYHTYKRVKEGNLTGNYCYQINKRVYKNRPAKNGSFYDPNKEDELGFKQAHYELIFENYK